MRELITSSMEEPKEVGLYLITNYRDGRVETLYKGSGRWKAPRMQRATWRDSYGRRMTWEEIVKEYSSTDERGWFIELMSEKTDLSQEDFDSNDTFYCPKCKYYIKKAISWYVEMFPSFKYCPNCGRKIK